MNQQEFIQVYPEILSEIAQVVESDYPEAISQLRVIAPEDLVNPFTEFLSRDHALGFVYRQVILRTQLKPIR